MRNTRQNPSMEFSESQVQLLGNNPKFIGSIVSSSTSHKNNESPDVSSSTPKKRKDTTDKLKDIKGKKGKKQSLGPSLTLGSPTDVTVHRPLGKAKIALKAWLLSFLPASVEISGEQVRVDPARIISVLFLKGKSFSIHERLYRFL